MANQPNTIGSSSTKNNLKLGYKTDIGAFTYINAQHGVIIEDYVQIGSHCSIYSVSTIDDKEGQVKLKINCKVGSHSCYYAGSNDRGEFNSWGS